MGWVHSVAYSLDGKHVLAGFKDGLIRMWDAKDDKIPPRIFKGHTSNILSVSYAPDGTRLASVSTDGTIRIWDVESGQIETNSNSDSRLTATAVSVGGKYFFTGSDNGAVIVWSAGAGEVLNGPFEGHSDWVTSLSFSPDPNEYRFASKSVDNTIRMWKLDGESIICLGHTATVNSLCFSPPEGHRLTSGSNDGTIRVWDPLNGLQTLSSLLRHSSPINSICYTSDGSRIVSASLDSTIRIWNSSNGDLIFTLEGDSHWVNPVACSKYGTLIVSGDDIGTIRVWDAKDGNLIHIYNSTYSQVILLCFSPDNTRVVSGHKNGLIAVCSILSGHLLSEMRIPNLLSSIVFLHSTDAKYIKFVCTSNNGLISIWCLDFDSQGTTWELQGDGWLTGDDGNLLFWVPSDLRSTLINGPCTRILNSRFLTKLILSENQGNLWTTCFRP